MAYATANPPALASQRVGAAGGAVWIYKDGDDLDTVTAINYVSNGTALGVKAGDRVMHIDTGNVVCTDLTATDGATIGTASGALCSAIEPIAETSIVLQSAGTGTFVIDDIVTFDNDPDGNEYRITTGDTDVSDGGTLVITPGLVAATAVGTGIKIKSDVINLSEQVGARVISGSAATRTLSKAESGSTVLFDSAAGIVYTLPASTPGLKFKFVVTVDLTSNAYTVDTDGAFIVGSLLGGIEGAATDETHFADGAADVGISMNKTTTGGLIGGVFELECLSTTLWVCTGNTSCTATPATSFTT